MLVEHGSKAGRVQHTISPEFELTGRSQSQTPTGFRAQAAKALEEFGVAHHLAQLGVLELVALLPVDFGMYLRQIERHEFREGMLDDVFPGAVVVVGL